MESLKSNSIIIFCSAGLWASQLKLLPSLLLSPWFFPGPMLQFEVNASDPPI